METRFVELVGAYNFRDLGGLPTADGRSTRHGVMFRSDALHHLEPADVDRLLELGVTTIVDLRSAAELEHTGRGLLGDAEMGFLHAPLSNTGAAGYVPHPELAAGNLGGYYAASLESRGEQLVQVIEHLADPANLPAVFHCAVGKDRTGMVAALVLELVGVGADDIVADYVLTDARMPKIIERFRTQRQTEETTRQALPAGVARAEANSMRVFLDAVEQGYGGAVGWARAAGVSDDSVTRLRELLVD